MHRGDPVSIDYYVWEPRAGSRREAREFRVAAIVPIEGAAADRDLVPEYPGITDSDRLADWDPPFPIDLRRVRPIDEEYWKRYRATPEGVHPDRGGQRLWRSRYGSLTALRIARHLADAAGRGAGPYGSALRAELDLPALGFSVYDVRGAGPRALRAARPTSASTSPTSACSSSSRPCCSRRCSSSSAWSSAFAKWGCFRRWVSIPLLFAGCSWREGSSSRSWAGLPAWQARSRYGAAIMHGLRTWWLGAVGTTALTLQSICCR